MGQITTGVGLVSGLDIAGIVDQLLSIEARPRNLVQQRNTVLTSQQVALQSINANLLSLKQSASGLLNKSIFNSTTAGVSDETVINATATGTALPGTYDFTVARLVSSQQLISSGFSDTGGTPVAPAGGTLTFEFGDGRLDADTELSQLNGGDGIKRGKIRIADRTGASSVVDLSKAITVDDVVNAINGAENINVTASVSGDGFVLTDNTGSITNSLVVSDVNNSGTAATLGLNVASVDATLTGSDVNLLAEGMLLGQLNDGNGVRKVSSQPDFQLATRDGNTFSVDITNASTIGDVIDAIETASAGAVTASVNGAALQLTDNTAGGSTFTVSALNNSRAASDLGILASDIDNDGTIAGERRLASLNSKLLRYVNGGSGAAIASGDGTLTASTALSSLFAGAGITTNGNDASPDITVQDRTGATYEIEVDGLTSVQDLINAFSTATGGAVTLGINGQALEVTNTSIGASNFQVTDLNGATVASELGITIDSGLAGSDTQAGNATNPLASTSISITDRSGAAANVDLTGAASVVDVIDRINAAGVGVTASLNTAGNGLLLTDTTGSVAGDLIIADVDGSAAATLNLAGSFAADKVDTGNLQRQYITEGTSLASIRGGKGVTSGKFRITDSNGASATVDLTQGNETAISDVLSEINSRGLAIHARINDNGDGILVEDTGSGAVALLIEEDGSSTAADLGLLGEAANPGDNLNGTFEVTLTVSATDTLDSIRTKINDAGLDVSATIINDGSSVNPFRLSLNAEEQGEAGAFVFDDGGIGFNTQTLNKAQNALVFYGSSDPAKSIAITSTTNTLASIVPGVTIDLKNTSNAAVRVSVTRDDSASTSAVQEFVDNFNSVNESIKAQDFFDSETLERGLLFGDPTTSQIRSSLFRIVNTRTGDLSSQFTSLAQVGVTVGSGAVLQFDAAKFQAALTTDRDAVEALFTFKEEETDPVTNKKTLTASGIGARIDRLLGNLTDNVLQSRVDAIGNQIKGNEDRIETLNERLAASRARLESQFIAMERALSDLQGQSSALGSLQNLAAQSGGLF